MGVGEGMDGVKVANACLTEALITGNGVPFTNSGNTTLVPNVRPYGYMIPVNKQQDEKKVKDLQIVGMKMRGSRDEGGTAIIGSQDRKAYSLQKSNKKTLNRE